MSPSCSVGECLLVPIKRRTNLFHGWCFRHTWEWAGGLMGECPRVSQLKRLVRWMKRRTALWAARRNHHASSYLPVPVGAASACCIFFPSSAFTASRLKLAPRCIGGGLVEGCCFFSPTPLDENKTHNTE